MLGWLDSVLLIIQIVWMVVSHRESSLLTGVMTMVRLLILILVVTRSLALMVGYLLALVMGQVFSPVVDC